MSKNFGGLCCGSGPDEDDKQRRKQHKKIEEELVKDRRKYKATQRLLLLGKSTDAFTLDATIQFEMPRDEFLLA